MCGICGFITYNSNIKKETIIKTMNDTLSHRGPDGEGYFINDNVALGHKRLSIIDLATGNQPIYNEDKTKCIVFNGEIYNFQDLKKELIKNGHIFYTSSDTEIILHLYEEKGINCVKELNGIFAFAIYDIKTKELFISRDRFGVKPLYYTYQEGSFVFGSELKSILNFPDIKKKINLFSLNYYLTFEHIPAPLTIYNNIYKLEQGYYILFKENKLIKEKYYTLSFKNKFKEKNENFYIENLDILINNATKRQMVSDVPLGCFLSGGIDSSLITSYLVKNSNSKINTFSIAFDEKSFDESKYFNIVTKTFDTNHHSLCFSSKEILNNLIPIIQLLDEPFADPSLLPTYFLSKFTRQFVKVSLSGDGSDEIYGGYPTYLARKIGDNIPPFLFYILNPISNLIPVSMENISLDFKIKKFINGLKYNNKDIRHQIWLGSFDFLQKSKLFSKSIKEYLGKQINDLEILSKYMLNCDTENNWERSLWIDMRFYLQDNMLVKIDRASMMNSLEVRVPYLDNDLVEFSLKIPSSFKYNGFTSKYILKKLAEKYLPKEIIYRKKKGFGIPIAKWINKDLYELFHSVLNPTLIKKEGLFNENYINKLLSEHNNNKKDNRKLLWTLFIFELWNQKNH